MPLLLLLLANAQDLPESLQATRSPAEEPPEIPVVHGDVDLHIHIAAHLAVPVYGKGPDTPIPDKQSAKHALRPQIFTEQLVQPGHPGQPRLRKPLLYRI